MSSCITYIDDIEDLIQSQDITPKERYSNKKDVTIRAKKQTLKKADKPIEKPICQSFVPGTHKIYVKTWGCAHNSSDSEYMAGQLATNGYNLTSDKAEADLWLLNSCTVKNPSEDIFRNDIQSGLDKGKHIVVAGCVPQGAPKSQYLKGLSIIGVQQIDRVVEVVEETLKGNSVRMLQNKKENGKRVNVTLALPKIRKNPLIEIIAINSGCLNQCTYCKTKHSRGELVSHTPEEIVDRAKQAFEEGVCEIWLTSEDTGTYGRDIGTSLPELLWKLVAIIPEGCMLRLGMTNPPYILEHLEEMAKIMATPRVYAFLHVPVQSGCDSVLADMKREYNRQDFERVVDFLREKVPGITIATDIICGFPTETEANFDETMTLCEKYHFPSLFINQYFPRPGTPAARLERIPANLVKTRTKRLTDLFNSYEPYAHRIGTICSVLVTEIAHDKRHYVGHNKYYEQVLLPMRHNLLGKLVTVKILTASKFSMVAEILDDESEWIPCSEQIVSNERLQNGISTANGKLSDYLHNADLTNSKDSNNTYILYGFIAILLAIVYRFSWKLLQDV